MFEQQIKKKHAHVTGLKRTDICAQTDVTFTKFCSENLLSKDFQALLQEFNDFQGLEFFRSYSRTFKDI